MRVLVIDHQPDQVDEFYKALTASGFEVKVADTGKNGLVDAVSYLPDIILLGEMLPHMTGNEVLKSLKNNQQTAHIPVIIFSNFNDKKLIEEAISLGAADYILKHTISAPDLVEKVQTILKQEHGGTGWQSIDANELF